MSADFTSMVPLSATTSEPGDTSHSQHLSSIGEGGGAGGEEDSESTTPAPTRAARGGRASAGRGGQGQGMSAAYGEAGSSGRRDMERNYTSELSDSFASPLAGGGGLSPMSTTTDAGTSPVYSDAELRSREGAGAGGMQ